MLLFERQKTKKREEERQFAATLDQFQLGVDDDVWQPHCATVYEEVFEGDLYHMTQSIF